jgi:hypothetical protein
MTKQSGLADSPFFLQQTGDVPNPPLERPVDAVNISPSDDVPASTSHQAPQERTRITKPKKKKPFKRSRNRDVMTSRHHDITTSLPHDIMVSCNQEMITQLRSVVKQIGKEPTTCRLTIEEKKTLKTVEFEYSTRDIKTTANEILRIAVNIIVDDYQANGEESILDKVLKALNE